MIRANQTKIKNKKIKNKPGFDANESRFGGWETELRKHKLIAIPSVDASGAVVIFEQAWNRRSSFGDVVKLKVKKRGVRINVVVTREELEQALAYMAQGGELIKFVNPKISQSPHKI